MSSAMNHDEDRYEKPNKFMPERWMKNERPVQSFNQYDFPVFQGGPRICIGKDLAIYETKVMLVEVVKRYRFEFAEEKYQNEIRKPGWEENVLWVNGEPVYRQGIALFFKDELKLRMFKR